MPIGLLKTAGLFIRPFSERAKMIVSLLGKENPDVIDMEPVVS